MQVVAAYLIDKSMTHALTIGVDSVIQLDTTQ